VQPNFSSVWHTGLSGGAPDSVRCARLVRGELATLGIRRWRTTIIHRTVRWCTGLFGGSSAANSLLSGIKKGDVAKIHRTVRWCTGLSGEPMVASANGRPRNLRATYGSSNGRRGAPDGVRCANGTATTMVVCARFRRQSRTGQATVAVPWRTGLSGASLERRQGWPSKFVSNGS
jgi:hypothetical protein